MTSQVLVIGNGVLADKVCTLLIQRNVCEIIRELEVTSVIPEGVDLALVLNDAWHPAHHTNAEEVYRGSGIPWFRGYVAFGTGVIGPLVLPGATGCSQCADYRMLMAESERREMLGMRIQFAARGGIQSDVWATRTGLLHMANLIVAEVEQIFGDVTVCQVVDHILCTHLKTLDTTRHFILPQAGCPICGELLEDSAEAAVIALNPVPKASENSFRSTSMKDLKKNLTHDYLDYNVGLMNGKVHDLITPFAAVSVNLPLMMGDEGTSGRAHSYAECQPIAILEGLERYAGLQPRGKHTVVYDSYANLRDHALDPKMVGLHASEAYARPEFPFQRFDDDVAMDWVWAYSFTEQQSILVPQKLAYYSLGCSDGFVYETSNGCALGSSLVEAIFHGILEVVERDAFLMTWYAQLPLPKIDIGPTVDAELSLMINRVRVVTGYDLHFYNATMENGIPTVFVIAKNSRSYGLNLLCAAGAHVDPVRALKGAIQETAGMLLRFDGKLEKQRDTYLQMLQDSNRLLHMEDHSMLYGLPEAEERLAFLLDDNRPHQTFEQIFQWDAKHLDITEDLKDLLSVFSRLKMDVVVVDQTSPELQRNGLYCVKVLIPGMLPMTFGHQFRRLEGLHRVFNVPVALGYADGPLTQDELNPYPHPFP